MTKEAMRKQRYVTPLTHQSTTVIIFDPYPSIPIDGSASKITWWARNLLTETWLGAMTQSAAYTYKGSTEW